MVEGVNRMNSHSGTHRREPGAAEPQPKRSIAAKNAKGAKRKMEYPPQRRQGASREKSFFRFLAFALDDFAEKIKNRR
jgi:hypothetical protein